MGDRSRMEVMADAMADDPSLERRRAHVRAQELRARLHRGHARPVELVPDIARARVGVKQEGQ